MNLRNSIMTVMILFLCIDRLGYTVEPDKTQSSKLAVEENTMFLSKDGKNLSATDDFPDYAYTAQVLREHFYNNPAKIQRFLQIAKAAGITLDPLFLGLKDSKPFTQNQSGYTDIQKAQGIALLKFLVNQQFPKATPSDNPTYTVIPGAPGSGKTFALQKQFKIDVAKGEFAENSITIGPDLVVMSQMDAYNKARTLPIGPERTKAMIAAYSHDRDLSNAAANFMFVMAMTEGLNIKHDSTMTAPTVSTLLDCLGKLGYTRTGRVLMVDKESRGGALDERTKRNGGFALVTTEDALGKAVAAYERIADGSYMGRFEDLTMCVQLPNFYLSEGNIIEVAKYNTETGKMQVLPGAQQHIDRLMQQARDEEGLKPELLLALEQVVSSWDKAPEIDAKVSNKKSSM